MSRKIEITEVTGNAGKAYVVKTVWEQEVHSSDESKFPPIATSAQTLIFEDLGSLINYIQGFLHARYPYSNEGNL